MVDSGQTEFPMLPRYENSYASLQNSPFPSQGSLDYERVSEYVASSSQFSPGDQPRDHMMAEDDEFHEEGNLENLKYKSPEFKQRFVAGRDSILLVSQEFLDAGNNAEQSDTYQAMSKKSTSKANKDFKSSHEQSENWKNPEPEKLAEKFGLEKFLENSENSQRNLESIPFEEPKNEVWI